MVMITDSAHRALLNLLAVIHRDGGHYTAQHGVEKACIDAEKKVVEMLSHSNKVSVIDQHD